MKPDFNKQVQKLECVIDKAIDSGKYEKALQGIAVSAQLRYMWNQSYTNDKLEEQTYKLKEKIKQKYKLFSKEDIDENTILFYDVFGLDTRGLALIYLKNLVRLGYKVIYVTVEKAINQQQEIHKNVEGYDIEWIYVSKKKTYIEQISELIDIFNKYKPSKAFLYGFPYEVSEIVAFELYDEIVTRFKINLTDHAFWLGTKCFDYCIEFREYGGNISHKYRKIDKDKIIMLPYYPIIDKDAEFAGLPFENKKKYKIIFSGGSLYKTIGENNTYYNMIDTILSDCSNVIFLYAGRGDDSELKKLMIKYQGRVFHIDERKDLYQLMLHIDIYINTYPMIGGLMTQYAAIAGKLPLMLKHNDDGSGILINQEAIGIEYNNQEELLQDLYKLLSDEKYKKNREKKLENSIISEETFREELDNIIRNHTTIFKIKDIDIDTSDFLKSYIERYNYKTEIECIVGKRKRKLCWVFPQYFVVRLIIKCKMFCKEIWRKICK